MRFITSFDVFWDFVYFSEKWKKKQFFFFFALAYTRLELALFLKTIIKYRVDRNIKLYLRLILFSDMI